MTPESNTPSRLWLPPEVIQDRGYVEREGEWEELSIPANVAQLLEPGTRRFRYGECTVLLSRDPTLDKWHLSISHVEHSPASRLRSPKVPTRTPDLLPQAVDTQLLSVAESERDLLALICLLDLGLRKSELAGIMLRDFDSGRRTLTVFGKGQKERVLPLRGRIVRALRLYERTPLRYLNRLPEPDDYLVYSEWRKGGKVYGAKPKRRMPDQTLHRWWYEHLQRAGLVPAKVERGMNMHRSRHTFAVELRRSDGVDLGQLQHVLGHTDPRTTEEFYGHYDLSDLERAMESFARRHDPN